MNCSDFSAISEGIARITTSRRVDGLSGPMDRLLYTITLGAVKGTWQGATMLFDSDRKPRSVRAGECNITG